MTLYVDTSALVRRYLHDRHRPLVLEAMGTDEEWCASALARTEAQVALHRASVSSRQQAQLWRSLRDEWEAFWVVPLDDRCMARAVEIGANFGVPIVRQRRVEGTSGAVGGHPGGSRTHKKKT